MPNKRKLSNTIRQWLRIRELPLLIFILMMGPVLAHGSPAFMRRTNFLSRARGTLQFLQPLECREYHLEIGGFAGAQEVDRSVHEVRDQQGT